MRFSRLALATLSLLAALWASPMEAAAATDLAPVQSSSPGSLLCFRRGADAFGVDRASDQSGDLPERLSRALEALVAGPTFEEQAMGVWSALPDGSRLDSVALEGSRVGVYLLLPQQYLEETFNPLLSDQLVEQISKTLRPFRGEIMSASCIQPRSPDDRLIIHILARDPWDPAHPFRDLSTYLSELPVQHKPLSAAASSTSARAASASDSLLMGKAVYLSAGHGWYWNGDVGTWLTQRPIWEDSVEDFNNAEVVNQYLLPYLVNAGADVWTARERDLTTDEITVTLEAPGYSQSGQWLDPREPVTGSNLILPWRLAAVQAGATATATWTFTPTATARAAVYVWYAHGPDRAPDAHYRIAHAGGISELHIDQTMHGLTWRYLGSYPFYADQPASVSLDNDSDVSGAAVVAGAVRVGGGIGSEIGGAAPGAAPSGRPRWEEASRYWAKFQGAPASVYHPSTSDINDDVTARPRYAEWEKPPDEDAVFVSWHTNGSWGHDARGTESYIYDGTWGGIWTPGSDLLQYFLHRSLVDDISALWDPGWADGGMMAYNFGEVRPLETMPGVLMEIAYHDIQPEAQALLDPRFAQITARAIYRGIVRYFAHREGVVPLFLPEPPEGVALCNSAPGEITASWLPSPTDGEGPLGNEATSYRIYKSSDGFAWGDPAPVSGAAHTLSGLVPGQLIFVRITGVNAGGESLPSPTLAARVADVGSASILVVDGFGRNDHTFTVWQSDGISIEDTAATGPSRRLYADHTNRRDYTIQHGMALDEPFDSATRNMLQPVQQELVPPIDVHRYRMIDWIAGEERTADEPVPVQAAEIALSGAEQTLLTAYLERGGALFISGADIGLDLVERGRGPDFYAHILKAAYQGDDAFKHNPGIYPNLVIPAAGGIFDGLDNFRFDDGTHGTYDADRVDYFIPLPEDSRSRSALIYEAGIGHAGMTWFSGACSRLVYLAFPFETIYPAETRTAVMARVVEFLAACGQPQTWYLPLMPAGD